jgi:hypothetical protein
MDAVRQRKKFNEDTHANGKARFACTGEMQKAARKGAAVLQGLMLAERLDERRYRMITGPIECPL